MARHRSERDIDPKQMDTAEPPRLAGRRAQPDPSPVLQSEKPKALARALKRSVTPGIMMEPAHDGDGYVPTSPHSDQYLWELQLADAFGTRSQSAMVHFIDQLKALCSSAYDPGAGRWKPDEIQLNAAVALIGSLKPRNEAEAALAAQMVAIHWMQMRLSAQALNNGGMIMEKDAALAGKLARTYAIQMDALLSLRGQRRTVKQAISVKKELHQHVHYHRGGGENSEQPQGAGAFEPAECATLQSSKPTEKVVRLPRRSGPRSV
ncbi:hypothetical protein U8326_00030 [Tsuneonella sp. CC-YZS046]|uniref:hypothetical protein n=1 Tax=Tsuneonella sp. CC-YZS046 TaxID=3042152 RepID=UPI002D785539|nr:hypothetical protein [Tsuneonella sp. CC-YZS046]WRO66592.1 hypothetical protein U8326_00030 [Tsuneonella sp. CC-YZS046]